MTVWKTQAGGEVLRQVYNRLIVNKEKTLLLVIGMNSTETIIELMKYGGISESRICIVDDIDILTDLQTESLKGKRLILLKHLCAPCINPIAELERYCRQNEIASPVYAPISLDRCELERVFRMDRSTEPCKSTDPWLLKLAHETALVLSGGVPYAYSVIREAYLAMADEDTLPDPRSCIDSYRKKQQMLQENSVWLTAGMGQGNVLNALRARPQDPEWIVLWSMGLVAMYEDRWVLSPFLLEQINGMRRELTHRIQLVGQTILPQVYLAWMLYVERSCSLREINANYADPKYWEIGSIIDRSEAYEKWESTGDKDICVLVRTMRNFCQHMDEQYGKDFCKNWKMTMSTCRSIMKRVDEQGFLRPGQPRLIDSLQVTR